MKPTFNRVEVKTYLEHAICPTCNQQLTFTGYSTAGIPPTYKHVCKTCKQQFDLYFAYPITTYERVDHEP